MRRVLLIGATGAFGSRLAALLATFPDVELVLAARGLTALTQLRNDLVDQNPAGRITVEAFDRLHTDSIANISPWLVIDTAGPFQDSDYSLAQAAIRCGADYIDIADARAFVMTFAQSLDNAGPSVPIATAAAMVRGLLDAWITQTGAQACVGLLKPEAILRELQHLPITTQQDEAWPDHPTLFRRLLGREVDDLPPAVRSVHDQERGETFTGTAIARVGRGLPARLLRWLVGLPKSGRYPVTVQISLDATGETWTRQFGQAKFSSRLRSTSQIGSFEEQFGPLRFTFDLDRTKHGVDWRFLRCTFFAVQLPAWVAPKIRATATDSNNQYRFSVAVLHPWLGLLFAYRGTLFVEQKSAPQSLAAYEATRG